MNRQNCLIGACGLNCKECDIFQAPGNPELRHRIADWLRRQGATDLKPQDIHCSGCKGDRAKHWSPDCRILRCCVDAKGFEFCYQCQTFPCDNLNEWVRIDNRYEKALTRLKKMKGSEEYNPQRKKIDGRC